MITEVLLLDLKAQYASIKDEVQAQLSDVLTSQHFILGPKVQQLEEAIAGKYGAKHAIGVASGSDSLLLALMALGVGPGDAVITSAFSFFASCGCISRLGAHPLFCDIDASTYNLDPTSLEALLDRQCKQTKGGLTHRPTGTKVRALIPVHLYGQCADMTALGELAARYHLPIIEDAAQSIGATHAGKFAGTMGLFGCYSFFPSKNLGAYGDGGMLVSSDDELAGRARILRVHGAQPKYFNIMVGMNSRLDALQAAVLLAKLPHLDDWAAGRRAKAAYYDRALADVPAVQSPVVRPGNECVYHQYVIRSGKREALMQFLKERRIGTAVYYPQALHLSACYLEMGWRKGDFPEAEAAAAEALALPIYPELTDEQQDYVVDAIREFHRQQP